MTHPSRPASRLARYLLVAALAVVSGAGGAMPLQPGAALPRLALKDQHDRQLAVTRDTRIIFVAAEMGASRMMAQALEALPPTALKDRHAVYIADISSMPEPISTIVAMPRMRKLPYQVAVVRHAAEIAQLPRQPGAVTVLKAEGGTVRAVDFAQTPEAIGRHLR